MELLKKWIAAERGRGVRLAAALHVPASFVAKMASGDKPIPLEHATAIEQFTCGAVTRKTIRPNDWSRIWPELADSKPNHPQAPAHQARAATESVAQGAA
jgi:DNA-binding transcriptional regulator YdaS (Cro superfamily)